MEFSAYCRAGWSDPEGFEPVAGSLTALPSPEDEAAPSRMNVLRPRPAGGRGRTQALAGARARARAEKAVNGAADLRGQLAANALRTPLFGALDCFQQVAFSGDRIIEESPFRQESYLG